MAKKKEILTPEQRLQAALVPDWEQPYKVPENWCWIRLGYSVNLFNGDRGSNYPSKKDYQPDGIPFINAGAIVNGELSKAEFNYISEEKYNALRAGKIKQGDILYCLRGSLGKTAMVHQNFKGAISSSLCILRTNKSILKEFLYYLLLSNVISHQQDLAENGSAQPNLSAASVVEYMIPLPPLLEQQRIVDRFESLFAKLDEAKQKAQDALDSFEPRKAAILHKAFTGDLTAQWRKEHGVGMESWKTKTSTQLFEYVTSGSRGWAKYYAKNGDMFVRMGNLDHGTIELDLSEIQYVQLPSKAEGQRSKLQKNDILISITADIGMIGLVRNITQDAYINQHIALARPIGDDNAEFIAWYLVSDVGLAQMRKKQRGATKIGLGLDDIRTLKLPMPLVGEQTEIVRIVNDLLVKEQQAKEAAEAMLEQIDLIKKSILAGAFRGELGTNDPAEESSIELLKEIITKGA